MTLGRQKKKVFKLASLKQTPLLLTNYIQEAPGRCAPVSQEMKKIKKVKAGLFQES